MILYILLIFVIILVGMLIQNKINKQKYICEECNNVCLFKDIQIKKYSLYDYDIKYAEICPNCKSVNRLKKIEKNNFI